MLEHDENKANDESPAPTVRRMRRVVTAPIRLLATVRVLGRGEVTFTWDIALARTRCASELADLTAQQLFQTLAALLYDEHRVDRRTLAHLASLLAQAGS